MYDSPPPAWYEPPEDDDHECKGVWCLDASHSVSDEQWEQHEQWLEG